MNPPRMPGHKNRKAYVPFDLRVEFVLNDQPVIAQPDPRWEPELANSRGRRYPAQVAGASDWDPSERSGYPLPPRSPNPPAQSHTDVQSPLGAHPIRHSQWESSAYSRYHDSSATTSTLPSTNIDHLRESPADSYPEQEHSGSYRDRSPNPTFEMPTNITGLREVLDEISLHCTFPDQTRLTAEVVLNFCGALCAGRAPNKVTIMLLGDAGQGKSQTINKLVGRHDFLKTGRLGSTTKAVQSVQVPVIQGGVKFTLSLDDTPGISDTTRADRTQNALIFDRYCQSFSPGGNSENAANLPRYLNDIGFNHPDLDENLLQNLRQEVFPNAILLTNTWREIKRDVQREYGRFATPLGRAVWAAKTSGLYDDIRPNVIVVVTKSVSDPITYLEGEWGSSEFGREWWEQAQIKCEIIRSLQDTVFPGSTPWPIVFVENGARERDFLTYEVLPNGQTSHQNLIDELRQLFSSYGGAFEDCLGLKSLVNVVAGSLGASDEIQITTTAGIREDERMSGVEKRAALQRFGGGGDIAVSAAVDILASKVLGHGYNPITKQTSDISVIDLATRVIVTSAEREGFDSVIGSARPTTDMYYPEIPPHSGIEACKIVARAHLDNTLPPLSLEILGIINDLPPWVEASPRARHFYGSFFDKYGTHAVQSAAFGGAVCIGSRGGASFDTEVAERALQHGEIDSFDRDRLGALGEDICCEGGRKARDSLIQCLRGILSPRSNWWPTPDNWLSERELWVDELIDDPVFLPRAPGTTCIGLDSLPGISEEQRWCLQHALRDYLSNARHG